MVDSDQQTHGVRELATRLDVSPSTVHRLISDLERLGLVDRADGGAYRLGLEFLRMAWTTSDRYPLHEVSRGTLEQLTTMSGESSFFAVYSEQRRQMIFAMAVESPQPLRYTLPLRQWAPLNAGASGLAILAFLPSEVQEAVAHSPLPTPTTRTLGDSSSLLDRLAQVRVDGVATTQGERIEGALAIAAPVFGAGGNVVGSLGISMPDARFHESSAANYSAMVRHAAQQITGHFLR